MTAISPFDLLKGDLRLSSAPMIFSRLTAAINNPYSTSADMGTIISEDSGLTARLLKIANSPFYGFPSKIESISHAVTIIGTRQLRELVLATSVINVFKGISPDLIEMKSFWLHSLACGIVAKILGSMKGEADVEVLFAAGMLHDIGRLVIFLKAPELAVQTISTADTEGRVLVDVEQDVMGFNHAFVGGLLFKYWKLPPRLEEVVASHHDPARARRYPNEAAIVHIANCIANAIQIGSSGDRYVPPISDDAWKLLGVSEAVFEPLFEEFDIQFEEVSRIFLSDVS